METGFTTKFHIVIDFPVDTHAFLVWLGSRLLKCVLSLFYLFKLKKKKYFLYNKKSCFQILAADSKNWISNFTFSASRCVRLFFCNLSFMCHMAYRPSQTTRKQTQKNAGVNRKCWVDSFLKTWLTDGIQFGIGLLDLGVAPRETNCSVL